MAAVMPATPTTPMAAATTTVPLPNYQVSGAGAAAAAPRQGASASGSVGAFFGVLAAVLVLTVLSCVFGRVCAAQAEGPDESYLLRLHQAGALAEERAPAPAGGASRGDKAAVCAAAAAAVAVTRDRALSGSSSLILCCS